MWALDHRLFLITWILHFNEETVDSNSGMYNLTLIDENFCYIYNIDGGAYCIHLRGYNFRP